MLFVATHRRTGEPHPAAMLQTEMESCKVLPGLASATQSPAQGLRFAGHLGRRPRPARPVADNPRPGSSKRLARGLGIGQQEGRTRTLGDLESAGQPRHRGDRPDRAAANRWRKFRPKEMGSASSVSQEKDPGAGRGLSEEGVDRAVIGFDFVRLCTAVIAQLVRAPDCESGGRGFESRWPPH